MNEIFDKIDRDYIEVKGIIHFFGMGDFDAHYEFIGDIGKIDELIHNLIPEKVNGMIKTLFVGYLMALADRKDDIRKGWKMYYCLRNIIDIDQDAIVDIYKRRLSKLIGEDFYSNKIKKIIGVLNAAKQNKTTE